MQGFVPQRSFIAMSSTCIDSVLMVCGPPDERYRLTMMRRISSPRRHKSAALMAKEVHAANCMQPEAAQNAAA